MNLLNKFLGKQEANIKEKLEFMLIGALSKLNENYHIELSEFDVNITEEEFSIKYSSWSIDIGFEFNINSDESLYYKSSTGSTKEHIEDKMNHHDCYGDFEITPEIMYDLLEALILDWGVIRENQ